MYIDYNDLFDMLNSPDNSIYVMIVFLALCALTVAMRIVVCLGYQSNLIFFNLNAKELKSRADIKNLKFGLLSKVAEDYVRLGEKGISSINTVSIIEKHLLRLNFIGWSYEGMASFVKAFENGVVLIGVLLAAVFTDYRLVYGIIAVAAFVLMRLFAGIFDFELVRRKLSAELIEYVEREVGQYYAGDLNSVILRFKKELADSMRIQSDLMMTAIRKLGDDLSGAVRLSLQGVSSEMSDVILKISNTGEILDVPLQKWRDSINEAEAAQQKINAAILNLEKSSEAFGAISVSMGEAFSAYSETTVSQTEALNRQLNSLVEISTEMRQSNAPLLSVGNSLESQLKYIEKNQSLLEQSVQQYEQALQDTAGKIGDGIGSIVEYSMQSAYGSLNEALEENITRIIANNNEMTVRFKEILEQIGEQSRSEAQAIIRIKEQMDLHFEKLSNRI